MRIFFLNSTIKCFINYFFLETFFYLNLNFDLLRSQQLPESRSYLIIYAMKVMIPTANIACVFKCRIWNVSIEKFPESSDDRCLFYCFITRKTYGTHGPVLTFNCTGQTMCPIVYYVEYSRHTEYLYCLCRHLQTPQS